ncbi:LTD domain-containing protein [Fusarium sp. Ph1]|nr:LTD domain-containing protein [Fusarium sp. Ph1]
MVVESYGVWRAKPVRYTDEDRHQDSMSPHLSLYFTNDEAGEARAAINIKSGNRQESRLAYWTLSQFTHAITEKLDALKDGFQLLAGTSEQGPGGLALDFIRGNLFRRSHGRILPHDVDGPDNDILDQLKPILDRTISADATVYIYGSDFSDGRGIHNDGALIFKFEDHWEAVFLAFASQAVHTEDGPNDAGQPLPRTGYMTWADFLAPELTGGDRAQHDLADSPVFITQAFVNPPGPDNQPGTAPETVTLTNRTGQEVDFTGWRIRNKAGEAQELPSGLHISAKGTVTVEVPRAPLSNQGGTITLLNAQGLKVHGVSYTKAQAQDGTVSFRQAIIA